MSMISSVQAKLQVFALIVQLPTEDVPAARQYVLHLTGDG